MSLLRQLALIISALFLLVFAGTLVISVNNTRIYLIEQMQSHAQDTATSLALSLKPPIEQQDWPTVNSMVDAIFDRGYYREMIILSTEGKALLERQLPVRIEGVPQWFIRLIPLKTPQGEALVTVGWKQTGKVLVRSHPGYAYNKLWRSAIKTFWWFVASWVIVMLLVIAVLRYALASLRAIEQQALAISAREFPTLEKLPWTRELRSVVTAMNKMSTKVKRMLDEQMELTEKVRGEAYRDPVTGLANQRYFETRLRYLLDTPDEFPRGALLLIELADFKAYNDRHGLKVGDELLKETARLLEQTCSNAGKYIVARLGGANFIVMVQITVPQEAQLLGEKICHELVQLYTRGLADTLRVGHVGIAYYNSGQTTTDLFSEADTALRAAQNKGPNTWYMYDRTVSEKRKIHSATHWQKILKHVIDTRDITLFFQPVLSCVNNKTLLHYEIFTRIAEENGTLVPATVFMPMAERIGIVCDFDKLVVESVLAYLSAKAQSDEIVAINVSPTSVHDPAFNDWLYRLLKDSPGAAKRMIFEATEYGCAAKPDSLRHFVDRVRSAGSQFSLDHFGVGFASFGYLRDLKLDYIKIDGSYIRQLQQNKDNQFFIRALTEIAHGLDIKVIAVSVEDQKDWDVLKDLYVDGVQGYLVGEPLTKE